MICFLKSGVNNERRIAMRTVGALIVGLLLGMGGYAIQAQQTTPRAPVQRAADSAKYQIFFGPFARADAYLVNTDSGLVWRSTTFTYLEGDPEAWMPTPRIDNNEELTKWLATRRQK